jgi:hypothetical protein
MQTPRWSFLQNDNQAISGLSDTLAPGSISQLGLSDELVFRAKFSSLVAQKSITDGSHFRVMAIQIQRAYPEQKPTFSFAVP